MKIKCIRNCTGIGYEDFKKGQTRNLKKGIANKLIAFGYASEVSGKNTNSNTPNTDDIIASNSGETPEANADSNPPETGEGSDSSEENDK